MLRLDGSYGEGGGQILRTALSLAALSGIPVSIENIRAKRAKPGLRPQHLTAVKALAKVTGAQVGGAELHSQALTFRPGPPLPGHYLFDVAEKTGSAGAAALVAQALLPPLLKAPHPSTLVIRGGTHVPWSPPAHYLLHVFLPALGQLGGRVDMEIIRWGWYPRGGGEIRLKIQSCRQFRHVDWGLPPPPDAFRAISAVSRLPEHIMRRQARRLQERLGKDLPVEMVEASGLDPGSFAFLWGPQAGFGALGARGKPAEKVADEVADAYQTFRDRRAAVDRHLADQVVLYLTQARGTSVLVTEEITSHLLTNIWVIEQFLGARFRMEGNPGERGIITCKGAD
jgi:RNA 3'-phosphate cyclase